MFPSSTSEQSPPRSFRKTEDPSDHRRINPVATINAALPNFPTRITTEIENTLEIVVVIEIKIEITIVAKIKIEVEIIETETIAKPHVVEIVEIETNVIATSHQIATHHVIAPTSPGMVATVHEKAHGHPTTIPTITMAVKDHATAEIAEITEDPPANNCQPRACVRLMAARHW